MAISLVVAANFAFDKLRKEEPKEDIKIIEKIVNVPVEAETVIEKVLEVEKPLEVYGEKKEETPPPSKKKRRFRMRPQT